MHFSFVRFPRISVKPMTRRFPFFITPFYSDSETPIGTGIQKKCKSIAEGVIVGSSFNEVVHRLTRRTIDLVSILEFLRFDYPFYDRTFLEEIRLLPPGSRLETDSISGNLPARSATASTSLPRILPQIEDRCVRRYGRV